MKRHFDHFIRSGTDWLFRRRSPALALVRAGGAILIAALAIGISVKVYFSRGSDVVNLEYSSAAGPAVQVSWFVTVVGLLMVLVGIIWEFFRQRQEAAIRQSKLVLAVESRGLRADGIPLVEAIPDTIEGRREDIVIDLRENIIDGLVTSPSAALRKLASFSDQLASREAGHGRSDRTIVYGGLTPVPFTFLIGVLLDDEGVVIPMDWDRTANVWRLLDEEDDGDRFTIENLDQIGSGTREVVLITSVSYPINVAGVHQKFPDLPVVGLRLANSSPTNHWSEQKQSALAEQFLNVAIALLAKGVEEIHLILACQNSVAFRLGQSYDKRNLPRITVYQYEQGQSPPYPWGVQMPVAGRQEATIT